MILLRKATQQTFLMLISKKKKNKTRKKQIDEALSLPHGTTEGRGLNKGRGGFGGGREADATYPLNRPLCSGCKPASRVVGRYQCRIVFWCILLCSGEVTVFMGRIPQGNAEGATRPH